jgi:NADH-quinone oxidoreductase subunit H
VALYHGLNYSRRRDKFTLPVFGAIFLGIAGIFLLPMVQAWLLPLFWFCAKVGAILFAYMWIRGTLPRFRYDQLMGFAWKFLFPVAMLNLLVTGFLVAWFS